MKIIVFLGIFTSLFIFSPQSVQAKCLATDKLCIMSEIRENAENIENKSWRDKVLRELAKAYTHEGYENKAIELIDEIQTPDTKAMTIRGIGMAAADNQWQNTERYNKLFKNLSSAAEKIDHPPSHAIAYTYIAMSQAFAGDNMGAMATAKAMENDALRHKAFGETAEIQAERGEFDEAMKSIAQIESEAFKNKAYGIIAGIFIQNGKLDEAYEAGQKITNAYVRTQVFQNIVNYDNEEENFKSKNASN